MPTFQSKVGLDAARGTYIKRTQSYRFTVEFEEELRDDILKMAEQYRVSFNEALRMVAEHGLAHWHQKVEHGNPRVRVALPV